MKQFKHQVLGLILLTATGVILTGCRSETSADSTTSSSSTAVATSSGSTTSHSASTTISSSNNSASSQPIQALDASIADEMTQPSSSSTASSQSQTAPATTAANTKSATATTKTTAEKTSVIWGNPKSKIYHVPGQHSDRNPTGNGVHFDSEAAAIAAGYRRSKK
ncbi:hypothetical protein ACFP1L_07015 [Lactiplantibacillus nangangensis]|uniref:DNA-entry nuclease n=1 Tax=Lactiplantibacillus nangangensis TaxID=2559917 RepID=A0ABW1SK51_9LACO|nr:hypothetical protein [Lactiplantibacillus nangangensis]